jgi:predicted ester cyclase
MLAPRLVFTAILTTTLLGCNEAELQREVNKAVIRQWVKTLNENEPDSLDTFVVEGFVRHSQATPDVEVNSLKDFKRFDRETREIFPDYQTTLEQLVAEGDLVAFWGTFSGTQEGPMGAWPATGESVELDMSGIFRLEEGKIAELWITWDNLSGLTQLGLVPELPVPAPSDSAMSEPEPESADTAS